MRPPAIAAAISRIEPGSATSGLVPLCKPYVFPISPHAPPEFIIIDPRGGETAGSETAGSS
jgi:hypothetical protein